MSLNSFKFIAHLSLGLKPLYWIDVSNNLNLCARIAPKSLLTIDQILIGLNSLDRIAPCFFGISFSLNFFQILGTHPVLMNTFNHAAHSALSIFLVVSFAMSSWPIAESFSLFIWYCTSSGVIGLIRELSRCLRDSKCSYLVVYYQIFPPRILLSPLESFPGSKFPCLP